MPYKNGKVLPASSTRQKVAFLIVSQPYSVELGKSNTRIYPLLNFYSVGKEYLSDILKEQFAREILPVLFEQYHYHKADNAQENGCAYSLTVYISNGKFEMKEKGYARF